MKIILTFLILSLPLGAQVPSSGFDPKQLEEVKIIDPFKSGKTKVKEANWDCASAPESSLSIELIATSVLEARSQSVAQFKVAGQVKNLREGEELQPGVVIKEIQRLQVFILNEQEKRCEVVRNQT